jgi:hypothetical protein
MADISLTNAFPLGALLVHKVLKLGVFDEPQPTRVVIDLLNPSQDLAVHDWQHKPGIRRQKPAFLEIRLGTYQRITRVDAWQVLFIWQVVAIRRKRKRKIVEFVCMAVLVEGF